MTADTTSHGIDGSGHAGLARPLIEFRAVGHTYRTLLGRRVRAVDGFTLGINPGEIMGLAGPNGAGKSTLISLLLGFMSPTDGSVRIEGEAPRPFIEANGIGYLSELIAISPRWKLEDAITRYALLAGIEPSGIGARRDAVIEQLGLGEHRGKRMKQLSKGNLQRVGLAQALLREERVLVLDEPTHGLDPLWTQRFRELVTSLRRPDRVIFIASHNLDELQRVADRVAIIDGGRLQRVVSTRERAAEGASSHYHLVVARGEALVPMVFPGATPNGGSAFDIPPITLEALNAGLGRLIADGGVIASVAPSHSTLEQQFREAVGQ